MNPKKKRPKENMKKTKKNAKTVVHKIDENLKIYDRLFKKMESVEKLLQRRDD
jgi:hypothetical protein